MKDCVAQTNKELLDYIKSIQLKPFLFGTFVLALVVAIMVIPMFILPPHVGGLVVITTTILSATVAVCSMIYLLTLYDNCNKESPDE